MWKTICHAKIFNPLNPQITTITHFRRFPCTFHILYLYKMFCYIIHCSFWLESCSILTSNTGTSSIWACSEFVALSEILVFVSVVELLRAILEWFLEAELPDLWTFTVLLQLSPPPLLLCLCFLGSSDLDLVDDRKDGDLLIPPPLEELLRDSLFLRREAETRVCRPSWSSTKNIMNWYLFPFSSCWIIR